MSDKELEIFDWAIRQMMALGYLNMRQHILVLRVMSYSRNRWRRFSDKEFKKLLERK